MPKKSTLKILFFVWLLLLTGGLVYIFHSSGKLSFLNPASDNQNKSCNINDTLEKVKRSTFRIERDDGGHGTGFALTNDGYILTNNHVIDKAKSIKVWADGFKNATIIKSYPDSDIALLKIEAKTQAVHWNDIQNIKIAEPLYAMGWPIASWEDSSISSGVYSRRLWQPSNDSLSPSKSVEIIQTDVSVNPGNSGGPLIDKCGVVGMVTAKEVWSFQETPVPVEGMSYAISSYSVLAQVKAYAPKEEILKIKNLGFVK